MKRLIRRALKRGQTGQSIVILALGFVGLIAFVGITVDISLLFVRYAQLRRAVDAASIAAAGQMREDRSLADVDLAARQFIEFHGIDPRRVWVESCANAPIADDDPGTVGLQAPGGSTIFDLDPQICTEDQRKLIRVTAEIDSETVFLQFVGWGTVRLQASAVAETAVLDVVVVLDVSESMLNETTYVDWAEVGLGVGYVPPAIDGGSLVLKSNPGDVRYQNSVLYRMSDLNTGDSTYPGTGFIPTITAADITYTNFIYGDAPAVSGRPTPNYWWDEWFWQELHLQRPQAEVNERLHFLDTNGADLADEDGQPYLTTVNTADYDMAPWGPNNAFYEVRSFIPNDVQAAIAEGTVPGTQSHPREACRVRFFPYSYTLTQNQYIRDTYNDEGIVWPYDAKWRGFVPTYNFYGCCNDPGNGSVNVDGVINNGNGIGAAQDGNFSDLICQPFKQARDATRQFLDRIDFLRGDRVGFVTFDRTAFVMDIDGENGTAGENRTHMIEDYDTAVNVLNGYIGVRAEPNFYIWNQDGGGWTDAGGVTQFSAGVDPDDRASIPLDYEATNMEATQQNNYPVAGNCYYQNSALLWPFSRYTSKNVATPPAGQSTADLQDQSALRNIMTPDIYGEVFWNNYRLNPLAENNGQRVGNWSPGANAYELWAQCRGTNIGGALREANNALTDPETSRREGTVWIMILLSDGAAGATDPARIQGNKPEQPDPYARHVNAVSDPATYDYGATTERYYGVRGDYGFYGACPPGGYETFDGIDQLGELMLLGEPNGEPTFPFCSDEEVVTRHFCTPSVQAILGGDSSVGGDGPGGSGPYNAGFGPGSRDRDYVYNTADIDPAEPLLPGETLGQYNLRYGNVYDLDIGDYSNEANCSNVYDVDDYARDWADFVGGVNTEGSGDATLPTIFTIGFGLGFEREATDSGGNPIPDPTGREVCDANVEDCLGEELLRYIADVGDNFQIDNDYQQDWRDNGLLDLSLDGNPDEDWGAPDACEPEGGGYNRDAVTGGANPLEEIEIFDPGENCGNYYNARFQAELEQVFDEIASRMFTRLAG